MMLHLGVSLLLNFALFLALTEQTHFANACAQFIWLRALRAGSSHFHNSVHVLAESRAELTQFHRVLFILATGNS